METLDQKITAMWEAMFYDCNKSVVTPPKFWSEDNKCCTPENGWEPIDDKLSWNDCNMVDQVVSETGVYLTQYRMEENYACILGTRKRTVDYFEITSVAYTPATRWEPEDADPFLISGHGQDLMSAFLAFMAAHMDYRLKGWAEAKAEHEYYSTDSLSGI